MRLHTIQAIISFMLLPFFFLWFNRSLYPLVRVQSEDKKQCSEDIVKDHDISKQPALKSFTDLLISSGSDKYYRHHYENYYSKWLEPYRNLDKLTFLEIGAFTGKSLRLWDSFFVRARLIVGLSYGVGSDIIFNQTDSLSSVKVIMGDQSKSETMERLKIHGPFDIIIDDGSHVPAHMIFSLYSLWNSVKPGGLFIIEDLETNYWKDGSGIYGYRLQSTGIGASPFFSAVSKLEQIQQVLMRHQIGAKNLTVMPGDWDLCSVEWGMNLVKLLKCDENLVKPNFASNPLFDEKKMQDWMTASRESNP